MPATDINTRRLALLVALYPGMLPKGTTYQTMKSYLNKARNPSDGKVAEFAEHYGVSVRWLRGGAATSVFEGTVDHLIAIALPPLGRSV